MPASTFEIIANNWEDENIVFCSIAIACRNANLYMVIYKGNIEVRVEPESENSLVFEIRTAETLEWYYQKYPMAKEEPEERIPYFVYHKSFGGTRKKSIAMANNYLDSELIWKFSAEYLKANPTHIISLNRDVFIDADKMAKILETSEYREGWCFNLEDSPS